MRRMIIWKTLSSVRTSVTSSIARPSPGAPWTPSCEYTHNLHVSRPGTARIASSGRTIMAHYMTDYAATRRDFRLAVPARFNWAFDTFDAWARDPGKLGDPARVSARPRRLGAGHDAAHPAGPPVPPRRQRGVGRRHRRGRHVEGRPGPRRVPRGPAPHRGGPRRRRLAPTPGAARARLRAAPSPPP